MEPPGKKESQICVLSEGDQVRECRIRTEPGASPSLTKLTKSAGGVVAWARVHGQPALRGWGARDVGSSEGVLETLDVYGEVPAFRLTERSGRPVGRALVEGSSRVMRLRDYSAAVARC